MSIPAAIVLAPLSALYGAVTWTRLLLYDRGLLRVSPIRAPVISVGNITTGGTGKTPLVEFIARALARKGKKVCVLTRGYGRDNGGQRVVVSNGQSLLANAKVAGDEPRLLAESLQGIAAVICDADRKAAGDWAIRNLNSEAFVLDDGFQHLGLRRNLNIVAIDATNPWGHGHLLPWGRLREPKHQLSRANCVVITRAQQVAEVTNLRREIEGLVRDMPIFTSRMTVRGLRRIADELSMDQALLDGRGPELSLPVAAFCGIGNPASFFAQLRNAGYEPVSTSVFRDHHKYTNNDITEIVAKAKEAGAFSLITTAKDAVKLRHFPVELPCYALEIEISIDDESGFLELVNSSLTDRPS